MVKNTGTTVNTRSRVPGLSSSSKSRSRSRFDHHFLPNDFYGIISPSLLSAMGDGQTCTHSLNALNSGSHIPFWTS